MEKEFNLSEKIEWAKFRLGSGDALHKEEIKEFIRLLKLKLCKVEVDKHFIMTVSTKFVADTINQLAGDKLI